MFKVLLLVSVVSFLVLAVPNWTPPYSVFESLIMSIAYLGWLGPWILILTLILNRLVNISLRIR
jgi:hypothetical protein